MQTQHNCVFQSLLHIDVLVLTTLLHPTTPIRTILATSAAAVLATIAASEASHWDSMSCSLHQHHSTCLLNRRLANICLQPSRACMPCTDSRRSSPQGCSQYRVSSSNSSSSSSSIQCSAISRVKRCCTLEAAAAAREQQAEQAQQEPLAQLLTCRRCFQRFSSASNSAGACSFHPAMYTGGEVAKVRGSRKMGAGHGELVQLSTGARPGGACACACVCVGGGGGHQNWPHWQLPEPQQAYQGGGEGGMLQ